MKTFDDEILNIAHRGASGHAPENTMASFERAVELKAHGVEFDVQLSKDGVPVIIHDDTLKRTTDGKGKVSDHTVHELRQLDAGSWFSKEFAGERIPVLDDLFRYAADKFLLNIEIKTTPYSKVVVEKVAAAIKKYDIMHQCLITSFDKAAVTWALKTMPSSRVGLIFKKETNDVWEGDWHVVAAKASLINSSFIDRTAQHQKSLVVWTVNDQQEMLDVLKSGVGRIITNYPDRFAAVIRSNYQKNFGKSH